LMPVRVFSMPSFWHTLPKPLLTLAPLANVTDAAFRRVIAKYSKPYGPSVMYTEFVSADGLMRGNREVLIRDLAFTDAERPIVAQFFTSDLGIMEQTAALARELGFDGVDINMGCPDRSIERGCSGAALIKDPKRARELIQAAKRGAGDLPVSVKTRLGYNKDELETWLPELLAEDPEVLTLHARTRKEMSLVPARWERVKRAVEIRDAMGSKTLIVGNGDVQDIADARKKVAEAGADGAMIGRGIFGRPWLWNEQADYSLEERLRIAVEHTKLYEELLGDIKSFALMKKHFKAYVEGFPGAKELRIQLMETENAAQVEAIIEDWLSSHR
jgi:nifR3 family TIM-barrel protein